MNSMPNDKQVRAAADRATAKLAVGGSVVPRSTRRKYDLRQLVSQITKKNRHAAAEWGPPAGNEPWSGPTVRERVREPTQRKRCLIPPMHVSVDSLTLELVRRASTREASRVHHKLSRGVFTLAIIANTAAYLGILCTSLMLLTFLSRGITGDRRTWAHLVAPIFGEALIPIALSLAVALFAEWAYKTVTTRLNQLDLEMHAAILELANFLSRLRSLARAR
jgi:biopolymer transport protein ExbB/TolQ